MRIFFIVLITLMITAGSASAQLGQLVVSADATAACCHIIDDEPGLLEIWVVHKAGVGVSGSSFSAPMPACFFGSWISDSHHAGVAVGDTQTGIAVGYGACRNSPVAVVRMNFIAMGVTPMCCKYPVLPHPVFGGITFNDCVPQDLPGQAGPAAAINGSLHTCPCEPNGIPCTAVPVEETTWGAVKELFNAQP